MRFRFVHASDLHLDTPFRGLGAVAPELAERLRDASLDALDRIVDKAIATEAAFVVFAGDLYDGAERGIRAQLRFRAALARLSALGIQSFVAHGNHDPEGGRWSAIHEWPEGVTIFPPREPASVPVVRDGVHLATVHGVSYGRRDERDNLALRFPVADDGGVHVGVLHTSVKQHASGHAAYSPCTLEDLRSRGMTYWALGHVHRYRVLSRDPWIVYPGNTQGRSIALAERGKKGAVVVEVDDGQVAGVSRFATDKARYVALDVDLGEAADLGELQARLSAGAERLLDAHAGVDLLVRAILRGRGPLHRAVKDPEARAAILGAVKDLTGPRVWWLGLEDHARPALDLDRIRQAGDLRAAILDTLDRWRPSGGAPALPETLRHALRAPGEGPSDDALAALIEEAALDVIERLTPEEG